MTTLADGPSCQLVRRPTAKIRVVTSFMSSLCIRRGQP